MVSSRGVPLKLGVGVGGGTLRMSTPPAKTLTIAIIGYCFKTLRITGDIYLPAIEITQDVAYVFATADPGISKIINIDSKVIKAINQDSQIISSVGNLIDGEIIK